MRTFLLAAALAAVACAVSPAPGSPDYREEWLAANPDSTWHAAVLEKKIAKGMPKAAMFAAWTAGTWAFAGRSESTVRKGSEWWRYELFVKDPEGARSVELRTWRVSLEDGAVEEVYEPGR